MTTDRTHSCRVSCQDRTWRGWFQFNETGSAEGLSLHIDRLFPLLCTEINSSLNSQMLDTLPWRLIRGVIAAIHRHDYTVPWPDVGTHSRLIPSVLRGLNDCLAVGDEVEEFFSCFGSDTHQDIVIHGIPETEDERFVVVEYRGVTHPERKIEIY